ncbi:ATP-binding protein [Salegentibacter sediminis]|uniref:ATP-binding protein n=1 Tax=Salegentibacter sediminis TaxID=1930251 RepID=UPI0009BD750E|nr:ATP-binding protein [Salegentibacter sediminis]
MNVENLTDKSPDKNLEIFTLLSHEIRTPLNAIIGISDLLQKSETTHREEYYKVLQSTSENLLELVNNILDFSKINSGDLQLTNKPFNIRKKLEHCLYSQQQTAREKGLEFKLEFDPGIPEIIIGDQVKFCQIFINLVSNSIKFTDEGEVAVSLRLQNDNKDSLVVLCEVNDTGIGIPTNQINRIFEPFHQGEEDININYAGTGLGLSITQKLIKILEGDLWVESEPGAGTYFRFSLPFEKTSATQNLYDLGKLNGSDLRGKKVLVVEDNKINILVISKYLELWQMECEIAETGKEALEKVVSSEYDIVLMDIHMPEMNGLEAIQEIRNLSGDKYKKLPVIALTAVTEIPGKKELYHFTEYLMKPFDPEKLKELISIHCK